MTSQNKYKKKIIFDVIEEEDEDKNIIKNNNSKRNNKNDNDNDNNNDFIENNNNENKLFIDSKYSNINGNGNTTNHFNINMNNQAIINDNLQKFNVFSKINTNNVNKTDKKLELLFDSRTKTKVPLNNKIFESKWNYSSNNRNFETDIINKLSKDSNYNRNIFNDINKVKHLFLPNIKSQNLISQKNKIILDPMTDLKKINFASNKHITANSNNYINDNTQATTYINYSTKKFTSSKINNIKSIDMNTDLTQFGMGLISAGSTTNNNIIIPILTKARPESNFNCGGGILKNFNDNLEKNNNKNKTIDSSKNIRPEKSRNFRKKICKSQEVQKRINSSMKNKDMFMLFPDIQRIMPVFHKIKIEKGMTNIKF